MNVFPRSETIKLTSEFLPRAWTLMTVKEVEQSLKESKRIPKHYLYAGFDFNIESAIFKPFWKISWKRWEDRFAFLKRWRDERQARWANRVRERKLKETYRRGP